jgi:hypothetical protein
MCYRTDEESIWGLGLEIGGEANLTAAIQVAQLALKHRQNKQQKQRIIVLAGRYCLRLHQCYFTDHNILYR